MAVHTYSLRTRINSPNTTPLSRVSSRSPRKPSIIPSILQLKHVIGTTTTNPSGLACCDAISSFAYCAGSVAVLATIQPDGSVTYRYFKARPTTTALNATTSYFDSPSTPSKRKSLIHPRRAHDESFGREWLDESAGQTWSARERIKAVTCVALSPDGKLLAVGETGYNPRVLLFSTAGGEQPLSIITDHTIGVRSIAFSPDSKYLATLGDVNDGFLHVWAVSKTGDVRLHSTNKCTTNICDMTWVGSNIVTVGTRHIKIWHFPSATKTLQKRKSYLRLDTDTISSPGPTPLQGRNCLLGKMVDATFTAISCMSDDTAVVCADDGHVCKLDLTLAKADIVTIDRTDHSISAICFQKPMHKVMWAGHGAALQVHDLNKPRPENESNDIRKRVSRHSLLRESLGIAEIHKSAVVALDCLADRIVSVDADGNLKMLYSDGTSNDAFSQRLSSHQDLVKGVQTLSDEELGTFFTWARNGEIRFWTAQGEMIRSVQCDLDEIDCDEGTPSNELRVVRYLKDLFMIGDRFGVLKLFESKTWSQCQILRGHSAEITDIAFHEQASLVVTCSRDRMVQLFQLDAEKTLDLIQTLDEHISAVQHVCFSENGQRLLSCSTDRTVIVRERMERHQEGKLSMAYLSTRVITLKAAPLSMQLMPQDPNILVVSTMDRHVVRVDVASGAVLEAFKVGDKDTDDTSILNSICLSTTQTEDEPAMVVGYSSIDKSIRVYDLQKGNLLGREAGHTEGVSDLALLETKTSEERIIVSTGLDSTIMIWSLSSPFQPLLTPSEDKASFYDPDNTPVKPSPASLPPLRKILSKMDMAEFVRLSSPSRESSPHRLRRKTSRLAISTSIEEEENARSPSPPPGHLVRQRSRVQQRSPSPPVTPKFQRANNGRLRRPPSVPSDLRSRQSLCNTNDFGTEQTCRMLRTYRKRLQNGRGDLDLDEIQQELEATLKMVMTKQTPDVDQLAALLEKTNVE